VFEQLDQWRIKHKIFNHLPALPEQEILGIEV